MEPEENYEDEVAPKKIKTEWSKSYSNKALEMMKKMGYENDKGLGARGQGRLEPVVAVVADGRRGLGLKLETLPLGPSKWDPASEEELISLPEKIVWLDSNNTHVWNYTLEDMKSWIRFELRKEIEMRFNTEDKFCDPEILNNMLEAKTVFDDLNESEMRRARSRSNPFETIRSSIFLNRAAVKMANIDSLCDFQFTNPRDSAGNSLVRENELLYFADVCAGPGGFSEYILFRKAWEAKGFGFTLKGPNDFKLDKFFAGSPESFDPYYGVKDDGNVFDESNQNSFADYIFKHCNSGVHFVMADGGFSVEGQENIQEILSKQLYLCQCLTALKILRPNGSFVVKLFDIFTPFSIGLIYLMYKCFEQISIIKPNSSRPANSERYLVCKWKNVDTNLIRTYLDLINRILNEGDMENDIHEIVDFDILSQDRQFISYVTDSNNEIGKNQICGLRKISAFCQNSELKESRQSEFRKRCLELWKLPDKLRQAPEVKLSDKVVEEILGNWYTDKAFLHAPPIELLSLESLEKNIESIYDWYFVPIGRGETKINACSIFLCKSRGNLLRYTENKKWEPVEYLFEVSPKSLFYAEIVYEYNGEGRTQTRIYSLHIIDAIMLGGIDVRRLNLSQRNAMCEKYSISLNKPFKEGKNCCIRSKPLYKLIELDRFFQQMQHYTLKDNSLRLGFALNSQKKFFVPGGILIFNKISNNFFSKISKSRKMLYYYDKTNNASFYKDCMPNEIQKVLYASFRNSFIRRLLWKWTNTMQVEEDSNKVETNILYRDDLRRFLINKDI